MKKRKNPKHRKPERRLILQIYEGQMNKRALFVINLGATLQY